VTNIDVKQLTVGELLATYAGILDELRDRGLIRTKNAPVGDLAEYACVIAYGGELARNSEKSFDLVASDQRRIQVKARNVEFKTSSGQTFSAIRSFDFDACIFILVDHDAVVAAYEWTPEEVSTLGRRSAHTNSTIVSAGQLRLAGIDVTEKIQAAWVEMLALGAAVSLEPLSTPDAPELPLRPSSLYR
jgi:hypothetical protein